MEPARLSSLVRLFVKIGVIGVGGPAAHVALMHEEVVRKRKWASDSEFALLVGATSLIPGPNSTELAMLVGLRRAGWRGLIVAGMSFIVPAFLIVLLLAANYGRIAETDVLDRLRYGIYPVVVAIIAVALVRLRRSTLGTPLHAVIGAGSVLLFVIGVPELLVLLIGGVVAVAIGTVRSRLHAVVGMALAVVVPELWRVFLRFVEIGSVIFGSGYVLFAYLDSMLVWRDGWISESVLLDSIAVGQVTPGPVFTSATFIGWEISGLAGAAVATLGIFLPSFVFAAICARFVRLVERTGWLQRALGGVTAASIALMAVLVVRLGDLSLNDVGTWALFVAAFGMMFFKRMGSMWLIGLGLAAGLVFGG